MEDNYIFKKELCYSFRIDLDYDDEQIRDRLFKKLQEYFTRYRLSSENKKDGTKHFQGVMWRNTLLAKKDTPYLRTYFKQKFSLLKGGYSLVSARKIKSLAAYCSNKEGKGYYDYNIPEGVDLGKWVNKDQLKVQLKEQYRKELKDFKLEQYLDQPMEVHETEFSQWLSPSMMDLKTSVKAQIIKFALKRVWKPGVNVRPPPLSTLLHICRQQKVIDESLFMMVYYNL